LHDLLKTLCCDLLDNFAEDVDVDLVHLHHFFNFGHLTNNTSHFLQAHLCAFGAPLRFIVGHYFLNFSIHFLEDLDAMGISKTDPKIVLVVQEDSLVVQLEFTAITLETIFVLGYICLIIVVMDDWRNQIVRTVKYKQKSTWLFRLDF